MCDFVVVLVFSLLGGGGPVVLFVPRVLGLGWQYLILMTRSLKCKDFP